MSEHNRDTGTLHVSEGTSEPQNQRELPSVLQTNTLPPLDLPVKNATATGLARQVRMESESSQDSLPAREDAPSVTDESKAATAKEPETMVKGAAEPDTNKPTVLIVEDTQELAEVIQATLESAGMLVEAVSHGAKGLERLKEHTPDVLLLDIGLPDMPGWKMLEQLREWTGDDRQMPTVIVITAYGDPANRLIGKLQGIHSYLIKPFTSDEVEKVVHKALNAEN